MAKGDIQFDVTANDKASSAFADIARNADKAAEKVERSGKEAGAGMDAFADSAGDAASTSAQVAGGLGDLGGALALMPGPLGAVGAGMEAVGPAIMGITGAADLAEAAFGKLKLGQLAHAAVTRVSAAAQWALNVAMSANPIGLVVIAIVALVAIFVIAYKKSETFRSIVNAAFAKVKAAAQSVAGFFTKNVPAAFQKISDKASAVKNWVVARLGELVAWVRGLPGRVTSAAGDLFGAIRSRAGAAKTWVTDRLGEVIGWIRGMGGKISSAASGIWGGLTSGVRGALNVLIDAWNRLDFSINVSVPDWVPGIGGKGFHVNDVIPDIPRLATGGVTTGPTLAMIGDNKSGREAVIPLDDPNAGIIDYDRLAAALMRALSGAKFVFGRREVAAIFLEGQSAAQGLG